MSRANVAMYLKGETNEYNYCDMYKEWLYMKKYCAMQLEVDVDGQVSSRTMKLNLENRG